MRTRSRKRTSTTTTSLDDEELEEDDDDEEDDERTSREDEDELEEVVSAETQEWDGLEAAEAEGEAEKTAWRLSRGPGQAGRVPRSPRASRRSATRPDPRSPRASRPFAGTSGFPMWLRFLTASLVIVASIAGATSASLILYLSDIANALKHGSILQRGQPFLEDVPGSGPQTILILGSDKRNQADQRQVRPLRHDHAAPPRPGPERDRPALHAARPEGRHPGLRDRQAQRRVLARRAEADPRRR